MPLVVSLPWCFRNRYERPSNTFDWSPEQFVLPLQEWNAKMMFTYVESPLPEHFQRSPLVLSYSKKNIFKNIPVIRALLDYDCMQYLSLCIIARRNSQLEAWGSGVGRMQHRDASKNICSKIGRTRSALIDGIGRYQQLDTCDLIKSLRIIVFSLLYFIRTTVRESRARARALEVLRLSVRS